MTIVSSIYWQHHLHSPHLNVLVTAENDTIETRLLHIFQNFAVANQETYTRFRRHFGKFFELTYTAAVQDIIRCKLVVTVDATDECLFEANEPCAILHEVTAVWMWSPPMWYMDVALVMTLTAEINYNIYVNSLRPSDACMCYISKLTTIGSDNGLSPGRRQAIIWTSAGILSNRT